MISTRRLLCVLCLVLCRPAQAELRVIIEGVDGEERKNVEARLGLRNYLEDGGEDEAQIRRLHRQAEDDIRGALQAYGYYSPRIRATLTGEPPDWRAVYEIAPGPPTRLSRVQVMLSGEGAQFDGLQAVVARSALREGRQLRHEDYENTKTALARTAYQSGFLDAHFTEHSLRVDPLRRTAEVRLALETGPRYYFGEVSVAQQELDPAFIARYVPIRPGDPFNPDRLLEVQFALADLGYFDRVEVQAQRESAVERRVPVVIATTPRPRRRYDVGLGYGTDTGARFTLGAEFRRLNRSGHKLRTDLRLSEVKNSVGADYRVPLGNRAGESLGFITSYTNEAIGDGQSRRYALGTHLSRTPGDWQRKVYLNYEYEESFVPQTGLDISNLLIPGVSLSRGEADNPIHARRGWYLFLDVHGAQEDALSDASFLQGRALLRAVLPLGDRARVLGRAEAGASLVGDFSELPASQRFFAGGDQSVRGYAYQSLGPRDAAGKVIGGEYLNSFSLEVEYRVWNNWGAAAFFDLGGADDDPNVRLLRGVGAGLRYRAPVGTVQLDLAHPLDGAERGVRPHLGIRVGL